MMNASSPQRFLIINIFGIGDVLFTTPLASSLRRQFPASFIGYVANRRACEVIKHNPKLDRIFIYEKDDYRGLWRESPAKAVRQAAAALADIRRQRFDVVLDLSLNKHASFLMWFLGIRRRIGFNYKNRSPFLTDKINIDGFEAGHVVEHYLKLLDFLGVPVKEKRLEVFIPEEDRQWAARYFAENGLAADTGRLVIGHIPGGGASWGRDAIYRRWPPERHAALADKIVEKFKAAIILLGDSGEAELGAAMTSAMKHRPLSLIGRTTLGQYLAVLARCRLVIVNDGGPLHMAVASGARTVSLIGPVDEKVYGPYPAAGHTIVTKTIACRPCYHHFRRADCDHIRCIRTIEVDEVLAKVEEALSSPSPCPLPSRERESQ